MFVFKYIVDYYGYLRNLLDEKDKGLLEHTMILIHRPFKYLYEMENCNDIVLSEFCSSFLKPTLTYNLKNFLIPYLKSKRNLPFDRIICYLNSGFHFESTNSLFYCILALEPENYGKCLLLLHFFRVKSKNLLRIMQLLFLFGY